MASAIQMYTARPPAPVRYVPLEPLTVLILMALIGALVWLDGCDGLPAAGLELDVLLPHPPTATATAVTTSAPLIQALMLLRLRMVSLLLRRLLGPSVGGCLYGRPRQ